MRRKMQQNMGAMGATGVALAFVLVYSLWGAVVLHNERAQSVAAQAQSSLAQK